MNAINLFPWREKIRQQQKRKFLKTCFLVCILAVVTLISVHYDAIGLEKNQSIRNQMLQTELMKLDNKIRRLRLVKGQIENISSKASIMQNIQSMRMSMVHLLSDLTQAIPKGVYLSRLEKQQDQVSLWAYTQSNTKISQMMRNLEKNAWIQSPRLGEIKKKEAKKQSAINEFILSFTLLPRCLKTR